jgi:energy-coupling factor transporter transmembrane protein EcfT
MMNANGFGMTRDMMLAENSPLRGVDPRTKLAVSLCASLAVMLPLERLAIFAVIYLLFIGWARLLPEAARQAWKLKWILGVLFLVDWLVVSFDLALVVTLRLILMAGVFAMFFSTTTPAELCLALVWLRVPYRYAFSLSLSFQSVANIDAEWRSIIEAQKARGAFAVSTGWRNLTKQARNLVCLTVPAVVLTARRAWSMTEAAYARGFGSPRRRAYVRLAMGRIDWIILAGAGLLAAFLLLWR